MRLSGAAETPGKEPSATTRALVVVFTPWEVDAARLERVLELTAERMRTFTGATRAG